MTRKDIVQIKNPKTGYYIKINRTKGTIISHKKVMVLIKMYPFYHVNVFVLHLYNISAKNSII